MVWKCPKCTFKTKTYSAMQKHYYRQHHKPVSGKGGVTKGKDKKIYTFKPMKKR